MVLFLCCGLYAKLSLASMCSFISKNKVLNCLNVVILSCPFIRYTLLKQTVEVVNVYVCFWQVFLLFCPPHFILISYRLICVLISNFTLDFTLMVFKLLLRNWKMFHLKTDEFWFTIITQDNNRWKQMNRFVCGQGHFCERCLFPNLLTQNGWAVFNLIFIVTCKALQFRQQTKYNSAIVTEHCETKLNEVAVYIW